MTKRTMYFIIIHNNGVYKQGIMDLVLDTRLTSFASARAGFGKKK